MSFQVSALSVAHPNRQSKDSPAQIVFSLAKQAISAPITYVHRTLVGQYTPKQDFLSRYQWADHHIRILHQYLKSPGFWIKWTQTGNELYIQVKHELCILRHHRDKAHAIYIQISRYSRQRPPINFPGRAIALTDFSVLEKQLQDIQQRICKANGQAHIDKSQEDVTDVRNAIEDLSTTPVANSWDEWITTHRASCVSIQSRIEKLEHTSYLYVIESEEQLQKLDGLQIGELQTLFSRTLKGIALKHYAAYVSREYTTLYREIESELTLLKNDQTLYHSSWGNYLWSYWESNHRAQAISLHQKIFRLASLQEEYLKTIKLGPQSRLPSPTLLQALFKGIFRSFTPPETVDLPRRSSTFAISEEWKAMRHRGIPISCGEPKLASALQMMFSDPTLAKYIFGGPRQIELLQHLYNSYLQTQWDAQWAALGTFLQTTDPSKAITFDQFISRLNSLYSSHPANTWHLTRPFYDLTREVANRTSHGLTAAFLSQLDQEKSPLFYTLVHQTVNATGIVGQRQTQKSVLHLDCPEPKSPETLETLLERQFNTPQERTYFAAPPEYLFIFLHRDEQAAKALVGIQEEFFLLPTHTTSHKGTTYELVSFTSFGVHYRKTDFGYTRIDNSNASVEDISQLDFLIAAQSCTDCVFRHSNAELSEKQLVQGAYNNRLRFFTLQFKMSAIRSIYGYSSFEVPTHHQETLQHLVEFIQLIATSKSFAERILEAAFRKNPNDDLEQASK